MEKRGADFESRVDELIGRIEPDGPKIHPTVRSLATIALHSVEVKYGENSENHLPLHNAEHAIDVTERAIELTNLLYEYIPEEYRENIYDLILLAGLAHDWEQVQGAGANEKASADYLLSLIEQTGDSPINTAIFKQRAKAGIAATEYEVDEETGVVNQINLLKGEPYEEGKPDPLRFILAFADINAIAMKGPEEMYDNAIKLFFERNLETPNEEALRGMLDYQELFIKSQLNDHHMKPIIDRYFPDHQGLGEDGDNEIYTALKKEYNPNIRAAYEDAQWLKGRKDIAKELEGMLHTFDFHAIAARLGKLIHIGRRR